ncbi:MAG: Ig-like domain repeat protein, partial [Thiotrichaceae bacterium]|nr:Ig-like domain repeat protein [Thiotrichaceae bacterium]
EPAQTINLDDYFADIDNADNELSYSVAENADSNVVELLIETNILNLTFINAGTSNITINAADPAGLNVDNHFTVSTNQTGSTIEFRQISPTPSTIGQEVYIPFTVASSTGSIPTGEVTISNADGSYTCSKIITEAHNGQSNCYMIFNEAGSHEFTAHYAGDANHYYSTTYPNITHQVSVADIIYTTNDNVLSESNITDSYSIGLSGYPSSVVEITITPDSQLLINELEAGQALTIQLFDITPVTINVTAIDDTILEGDHIGLITHNSSTADPDYNAKTTELSFNIVDNEAGVSIQQTDGISEVIEGGNSDNYSIVLSVKPSVDVTVNSLIDGQISAYPTSLTFSRSNWNKAQNVRISAVDDQEIIQNNTASIVHSLVSTDPNYENATFIVDGQVSNTISVNIIDNDFIAPLSPSAFNVNLDANNQAIVSWQDNSLDETQFILIRDGQVLVELAVDTTSYTDNSILCDIIYQYQISARNEAGDSALSAPISLQFPCLTLQTPSDLAAIAISETQIDLTWTDNNVAEIGYQIIRDGQIIDNTAQNANRYTDSNLQCATTYQYQISAIAADLTLSPATDVFVSTQQCAEIIEPEEIEEIVDPPVTDENIVDETPIIEQQPPISETPIVELPAEFSPLPVIAIESDSTLTQNANIGGQTVSNIDIQQGGSVSNGTLGGEVINGGLASNITIEADATITGGLISGKNINYGTMQDVTISAYSEVIGGQFAGEITNRGTLFDVQFTANSTITGGKLGGIVQSGGVIMDVQIRENARIIGGIMGGVIQGTKSKPAYLGNIQLLDGSKIENVRISPTTELSDNIEIGAGVIFPKSYKNPDLEDFGVNEAELETIDSYQFNGIEPAAFALFKPEHIAQLPLEVFVEFEAEDIENLQSEAVEAIEVEQFEQLTDEALEGLTADNVDALNDDVLEQAITPEKLDAIKPESIKQSKKPGKIFTKLKKIKPKQARKYLPDGWDIDNDTGELSAPVGTKLTYKSIEPKKTVSKQKASFPEIADLESSFSLGGTGGKSAQQQLNSGIQQTPNVGNVDLSQFIFTQNDTGMLNIVGTGVYQDTKFAFLPSVNNIEQAPLDAPVGLSQDEGGFFIMTTPNQQRFFLTPSTNDPVGLVEAISNNNEEPIEDIEEESAIKQICDYDKQVVKFNDKGDTLFKLSDDNTRRIRAFETNVYIVAIFDAFVEPAPSEYCHDKTCDWAEMPAILQMGMHLPNNLRARQQATVVYPDGTAQIVYPTVLEPETFINLVIGFEGIEKITYQSDGSFKAVYFGQTVSIYPTFDTYLTPLANSDIKIAPLVQLIGNNQFSYAVQDCSRLITTSLVIE